MTPGKITGWKTYAAATLLITAGLFLTRSQFVEGVKWILIGCAFIGLRDALASALKEIGNNKRAVADLRAAIEAELTKGKME